MLLFLVHFSIDNKGQQPKRKLNYTVILSLHLTTVSYTGDVHCRSGCIPRLQRNRQNDIHGWASNYAKALLNLEVFQTGLNSHIVFSSFRIKGYISLACDSFKTKAKGGISRNRLTLSLNTKETTHIYQYTSYCLLSLQALTLPLFYLTFTKCTWRNCATYGCHPGSTCQTHSSNIQDLGSMVINCNVYG